MEVYSNDDEPPSDVPEVDDPVHSEGYLVDQQPPYDQLINAEVALPQNDKMRMAKVIGHAVDPYGQSVETYNDNHLLSSIVYEVQYLDEEVKEYSANTTTENFLSQVPYTIKKHDVISSAVKSCIRRVIHKYGIKILTTTAEAEALDRENTNSLWRHAIGKEMKNVGIASKILCDGTPMPVGWPN
eukprot:11002661-Ditylum_brightwellii.AAC.1